MKYLILTTAALTAVGGCGSTEAIESFKLLENSTCFRIGPVEEAGIIAPEQIALCRVMKEDDASAKLEELYSSGSRAGKLYALLGLRFVDRAKYKELMPPMRKKTCKVHAQKCCDLFEEEVRVIVKSIEAGDYDNHIRRGLKSR